MSYSKSTKTIKNFDRVDGQKKRQQDGQKKHNSRLRRKCAEALTKKGGFTMRTRTKRIVALLAGTAMLGSSFASFAATDVAANDLAYKGELEIMHYSTSEESEGNGGSDGFRTVLQAWDEAHVH